MLEGVMTLDAQVKVLLEGKPVHRFFAPDDFLMFGLGNEDEEGVVWHQIVDMPVDTYIGLAEPIPTDDIKRHKANGAEQFRKEILEGRDFRWSVPYLNIARNEDDVWKVVGHDGRHRAKLLKEVGYDTIPVVLHVLRDVTKGALESNDMPQKLFCQNDKNMKRERDWYPFPIKKGEWGAAYVEVEAAPEDKAKKDIQAAEDAVDAMFGIAPEECVEAKRNFKEPDGKTDEEKCQNLERRKITLPFNTLQEFHNKNTKPKPFS